VAAVVALAHNLGKRVTAERVETAGQLAFLNESGCDAAQGYLLGRPETAEVIGRTLKQAA
jgi:EAL domain-containing protein (putative c-di-GMP-specific phosphodiesterase class I)